MELAMVKSALFLCVWICRRTKTERSSQR